MGKLLSTTSCARLLNLSRSPYQPLYRTSQQQTIHHGSFLVKGHRWPPFWHQHSRRQERCPTRPLAVLPRQVQLFPSLRREPICPTHVATSSVDPLKDPGITRLRHWL